MNEIANPYGGGYYFGDRPSFDSKSLTGGQRVTDNPFLNQRSYLPGRIVQDVEDFKPGEVPMDGSISLFLKSDGTAIYARYWDRHGVLQTTEFVPVIQQKALPEANQGAEFQEEIMKRLDRIEKSLRNRNQPYQKYKKPKEDRHE